MCAPSTELTYQGQQEQKSKKEGHKIAFNGEETVLWYFDRNPCSFAWCKWINTFQVDWIFFFIPLFLYPLPMFTIIFRSCYGILRQNIQCWKSKWLCVVHGAQCSVLYVRVQIDWNLPAPNYSTQTVPTMHCMNVCC